MTARAGRLQQDPEERCGKAAEEGTDGGKLPRDLTDELRVLRFHRASLSGSETTVKKHLREAAAARLSRPTDMLRSKQKGAA